MSRLAPRTGWVFHLEVRERGVENRAVAGRPGRHHPLPVGVVGEGRRLVVGAHRRQAPFYVEGVVVSQDVAIVLAVQVAAGVVVVAPICPHAVVSPRHRLRPARHRRRGRLLAEVISYMRDGPPLTSVSWNNIRFLYKLSNQLPPCLLYTSRCV